MSITKTVYALRINDDFGSAYAVASGLSITNCHPDIVQARFFSTREAANYFLTLQTAAYQKACKVVEFEVTFMERK